MLDVLAARAARAASRLREVPGTRLSTRVAWLLPALVAGVAVDVAYLLTHEYPAFGAGMFFVVAEQVGQHGYALPETIPYYTTETIPFAYSPLMFYVVALLRDLTGMGPVALGRILPAAVVVLYLVPTYLLAGEWLGSDRRAGVATLLVAVSPPVLQWQVSAGGVVRAPAFLFAVTGLYAGTRLLRTRERRWLLATAGCFALTVLTHPVYAAFFGLSLAWMWLATDRTLRGLLAGSGVAAGGLLLTAPWWALVVARHGVEVFAGAAGTHGGIGKQLPELASLAAQQQSVLEPSSVLFEVYPPLFDLQSVGVVILSATFLVHIVAAGYAALHRRAFLSGWFVIVIVLLSKARFSFFIGSLLATLALFEGVLPWLRRRSWFGVEPRRVAAAAVVLVAGASVGVGTLYAGSHLDSHAGSTSLPEFVDDSDVDAMAWAREHTDPSAKFVVLGDAAEWFPLFADRTILVGPWGVEWRGAARYQYHLGLFNRLSTCPDRSCLATHLVRSGVYPDYVYVPKDRYTVRGMETAQSPEMVPSMVESGRFELAYENAGVMVFRVETM